MEKLILDLPPSVNRMFIATARTRFVHSAEYSNYLEVASWEVKMYCKRNKIKPITWYCYLDIDFYLKDVRSDSHNLKKCMFDALENGGLFSNDRYIMDRTQKVEIDKKNPRVEITVT